MNLSQVDERIEVPRRSVNCPGLGPYLAGGKDMTERICSIPKCGRKHLARGYCSKHYRRWKEGRDLYADNSPEGRFFRDVARTPNCWDWTGRTNENGYGRFFANGKTHQAHRWSYEYHIGPIPEGHDIHHKCHNKRCVRPSHLEPQPSRDHQRWHQVSLTCCKRGHPFTPENTYIDPGTRQRVCRICRRERGRAHYRKVAGVPQERWRGPYRKRGETHRD